MVFCAQRVLILLLCMGLLTVQPDQVYGLRRIDLLRQNNQRSLKATTMEEMNTQKNSTQIKSTFDPNQSSKRRVRRGSDPIHNRS
ncbi:hypothetical protein Pint_22766 [Pistacia integerrima]|uniref:Uncharacterized protein n=1 Tax=Pistacia integerrima TaxID=434235 RepID=A0ACC0YL76_9ROSI|nr:hypothetical protein Pint_22766 [Pistacia integerrima]